eukprot:gene22636-29781_t
MLSSTGAQGLVRGASSIHPSALASASHHSIPKGWKKLSLIASLTPAPGSKKTVFSRHHRKPVSCNATDGADARSLSSPTATQPPHSGYHFDGTSRRFFEGWYWKVQLPGTSDSFAVIFSVEDPGDPNSPSGGLGVQVMGPKDSYICQFQKNIGTFWADRNLFEPHWQVLMADGLASGHLIWGDQRYDFTDAPCYAEKNWGGGFPSKWAWIQCNSFDGQPDLSVTAVGARRGLLLGVPGVEEDVGMIGIHYNGDFIELVPWTGDVSWDVAPWGKWTIRASSRDYDALIEASCPADAGAVLRMKVWRKVAGARELNPFIDATTTNAALEAPIDIAALAALVPKDFQPPGL